MTKENAIADIRSRWKELYPADGSGKGIICPLCGSGSGKNGTGIRENPQSRRPHGLKCFACGFAGDVIDLIQQEQGGSFPEALQDAADRLHIRLDPLHGENDRVKPRRSDFPGRGNTETPPEAKTPQNAPKTPTGANADYTAYFQECSARINDPAAVSYLSGRGISAETAAAYGIGFDPAADPANAPGAGAQEYKPHPCPRIIIPTGADHYTGRSIDQATPKAFQKMNAKGSTPGIFNARALYDDAAEAVFVTEGVFDALSVIEAGAAAIALNSTENRRTLLKRLEQRRTGATLILCLDNDQAGSRATQELKEGLQRLNISYVTADICGGSKDPNEALTADRPRFLAAIQRAQAQTAARPDSVSSYIDRLMAGEIARFREAKDRKTGFPNLDAEAGGLYTGLYVIAAVSTLGKTTFAHQIADQLAAAGNDVLFFSMEQSRLEMVSKSLARITAQRDIKTAVTSLSIRKGYLPENVLKAADDYKAAIADRLSIVEGNFACNVSFIGEYTRRYMKQTGSKPVLFIDYLQILQGEPDKRQTTKEVIDSTVTELKRLSRELDLTVFVISSVNRANYLTPIDFESLKESGGIEYTADVIWGLQFQCLNADLFSDPKSTLKAKRGAIKEAKAADPRKIELVCLKNRYGISSFSCYFDYYPANDLYMPGEIAAEFADDATTPKKAGRKL